MTTFIFVLPFLAFETKRFDGFSFCLLCRIRSAKEPLVCFFTMFDALFFSASFGDFFDLQRQLTEVPFQRVLLLV